MDDNGQHVEWPTRCPDLHRGVRWPRMRTGNRLVNIGTAVVVPGPWLGRAVSTSGEQCSSPTTTVGRELFETCLQGGDEPIEFGLEDVSSAGQQIRPQRPDFGIPGADECCPQPASSTVALDGGTEFSTECERDHRMWVGSWSKRHQHTVATDAPAARGQISEDRSTPNPPDHALRRCRPLARRDCRTARPPRVAFLARNPCLWALLRLLG